MSLLRILAAGLAAFALGVVLAIGIAGADPSESMPRLLDALSEEAVR